MLAHPAEGKSRTCPFKEETALLYGKVGPTTGTTAQVDLESSDDQSLGVHRRETSQWADSAALLGGDHELLVETVKTSIPDVRKEAFKLVSGSSWRGA